MSDFVMVVIYKGLVETVIGATKYFVLDTDLAEVGQCPYCSKDLLEDGYCSGCEIDWDDPPDDEVIYQRARRDISRYQKGVGNAG